MTKDITHIYIYNRVISARKIKSFTQNYCGQRDIINNIKILIKWVTDTINAVIPKKYQNYPSDTILKHANVLAKVNKSPSLRLPNMMPHEAYSIIIHAHKMTI